MKRSVKYICITGIGIALFVALSMCLQVPVFENYYLCIGYVAMAVYCYCMGTFSGTVVGTLGVLSYCLLINGLRGMPGWAAGNMIIGIALGSYFHFFRNKKITVLSTVTAVVVIIISTAAGILGVKSVVEWILYAQPFLVRAAKNIYAFAADAFVLMISLPICALVYPKVKKYI